MLLASGGQRSGILLNTLSSKEQFPQEKYLAQTVNDAKVQKNCTECSVIDVVEPRERNMLRNKTEGLNFNGMVKD